MSSSGRESVSRQGPSRLKAPHSRLIRLLVGAMLIVLVATLLRRFVIDVHAVVEQSMWPALEGDIDHVLVCRLQSPERWQIWEHEVFGAASGAGLRIKRIIGLEGEFVDFRNGDLWIGPDRSSLSRALRPPEVVEPMLVSLGKSCGPERFNLSGSGRITERGPGELVLEAGSSGIVVAFRGGGDARSAEGIENDYRGKDGLPRAGGHPVPDVRVDVTVLGTGGGGTLTLRHELGGGESRAVSFGANGITVTARSEPLHEQVLNRRPRAQLPLRVRLETLDGVFRVLELDFDSSEPRTVFAESPRDTERFGTYSRVSLELDQGSAAIARLDVVRDVYYFWPARLTEIGPYFVDPDHVYVVGDNVAASEDSRVLGPVARQRLKGRAVRVVWPVARMRALP